MPRPRGSSLRLRSARPRAGNAAGRRTHDAHHVQRHSVGRTLPWRRGFYPTSAERPRSWVRAHAQDYVLEYFRLLSERRKNAHTLRLDRITAQAFYHHNKPPHPNEIAVAMAELKRGIDEDWQASVQRYPEVLQYFFGLVELTLPGEHEACVKDPPLSAMNGRRKATRRPPDALNNETALVRLRDRRSPFYGGYM